MSHKYAMRYDLFQKRIDKILNCFCLVAFQKYHTCITTLQKTLYLFSVLLKN